MTYDQVKACMAKGKRPKGMGYGDYSAMMKANDDEPMDQDDYEDMDEDEGEEEEGRKSMSATDGVNADDLIKALDDYEAVEEAIGETPTGRQEYLEARQAAGTITKSERQELGRLWAGDPTDGGEDIHKSTRERVTDIDPDLDEMFDASPALANFASAIDTSFDEFRKSISNDGRATRQLLKAQGTVLRAIGQVIYDQDQLIKSQTTVIEELGKRLKIVETTPQAPRATRTRDNGVQRPITKSSVGGDGPTGDDLSKAQLQAGMRRLLIKAGERGDEQAIERLTHNTAKLESFGRVDDDVRAAVEAELTS